MNTTAFWEIINSGRSKSNGDYEQQVEQIKARLKSETLDELVSFAKEFNRAVMAAYSFPLMVAAFVINGYISDDLFQDFREWLVLLGDKEYRSILKDPDRLASVISRNEVNEVGGYGLGEVPLELCLDKGTNGKKFMKRVGTEDVKKIKEDWPADRAAFERQYPVIYQAFWDQKKILANHK